MNIKKLYTAYSKKKGAYQASTSLLKNVTLVEAKEFMLTHYKIDITTTDKREFTVLGFLYPETIKITGGEIYANKYHKEHKTYSKN